MNTNCESYGNNFICLHCFELLQSNIHVVKIKKFEQFPSQLHVIGIRKIKIVSSVVDDAL